MNHSDFGDDVGMGEEEGEEENNPQDLAFFTKVKPGKNNDDDIPQPAATKAGLAPKAPFRMLISGSSGSGKTTVACHILGKMFKNYFHEIMFFSPTVLTDPAWDCMDIEDDDSITVKENLDPEDIYELYDKAEQEMKGKKKKGKKANKSMKNSKRRLIVVDDGISNKKFMKSDDLLKIFVQGRHLNISIVVLTQSYMKVERSCRLQASDILFFPSNFSEVHRVSDEHCPPNCSTKDFKKLVVFATSNNKHDFLYIKRREDPSSRFRRNFDQIITLPSGSHGTTSSSNRRKPNFADPKQQDRPLRGSAVDANFESMQSGAAARGAAEF